MNSTRRAVAAGAATFALVSIGCWMHSRADVRGREWGRATREDLVLGFEVTGTLKAVESDSLGPPPIPDTWDFKISMLAPEGAEVRKGRPVLAFDTSRLAEELEQKTAEADSARTEIEKTRADLIFQRENDELALAEVEARLRKASLKLEAPLELVAANERKEYQTDSALAEREIAYLERKLEFSGHAARERLASLAAQQRRASDRVAEIRRQIAMMRIAAPRDGTVIYVPDWRGDKKKVGDSSWRGQKILEIPDLSAMMAQGEVDESDAGKVSVGQRVRLRLDAHPDFELEGTLVGLAKTVTRQSPRSPAKVLRVELSLHRTVRDKMRPGMRFRGTIEQERAKEALLVPLQAVASSASGPVAHRRRLFSVRRVPVRVGRRNSTHVEVLSGLSVGDRVLLEGHEEPAPSLR